MKKVNCFKNSDVNVMADNAGEKKKILDGCKFCMEKRGCKCDKAEKVFNQPSILSAHSPDNWVKYSAFISDKPLDFPLMCYEYGPAFLRYCEHCQVVYESRGLNETCPHCGKLGIPVSDLYQDAYGSYLEKDYYYTGFYNPCPYEKGLGCTNAHTENCGKDCFYHPFHIHCSEPEEAYDILAGYYDEDEFDGFEPWEIAETLQEMALERELDMCYDELGGYFSEDEDMSYRDDEEEYWHFNCYEELYWLNEYDCLDEEYWFDAYDLECYYRSLAFQNITMSTREIIVALDLVESIFCGVEHPTHEEEFEKDIEFFRNYKFECEKTRASWLTCNHRDKCL